MKTFKTKKTLSFLLAISILFCIISIPTTNAIASVAPVNTNTCEVEINSTSAKIGWFSIQVYSSYVSWQCTYSGNKGIFVGTITITPIGANAQGGGSATITGANSGTVAFSKTKSGNFEVAFSGMINGFPITTNTYTFAA